ncbi:MAG: endonuclease/exonuclease/phosphatase family protein [Pseudomonadales bacterium]|jgi:endonuclease/exonuclease/phosphatase family metal-dependent hydrolase|nr:endonuclease/exonuclease/phosphatase family protein [Pseudomonadales bacterium]
MVSVSDRPAVERLRGTRRRLGHRLPSRFVPEALHVARPLPDALRLLSFNIQSGIRTERYREYVTRGWRQLLHDTARPENLDAIGAMLRGYDLVALQEVDAGSLRSGFTNQVAFLARRAGLGFWYAQRNRRLGRFAQHGNGLLACTAPLDLEDHPLPSTIPGRGAIVARFECADGHALTVLSVHLSLGYRARHAQLEWLAERVEDAGRVIVMGDMNASVETLLRRSPLARTRLQPVITQALPTYPSWRPRQDLDHVLVSPDLEVRAAEALPCRLSDHLPLAVELQVRPRAA